MSRGRRMAILGSGPIGLECLLQARLADWDAELYERGRICENVRGWGHVRMFSPWRMNVSEGGAERVDLGGIDLETLPTGAEYIARYLEPLAAAGPLAGHIHPGTEAVAVSRGTLLKGDEIGTRARSRSPFRLLFRDARGERVEIADVVVDATGTFATPNWLGPGGIPALGEHRVGGIVYRLPELDGRDRARFAGRRTLVVGAGHSAASAIAALGALEEGEEARVVWVTRSEADRPVPEVLDDPLAERARIARAANEAAANGSGWLERTRGAYVYGVERRRSGSGYRVALGVERSEREIEVDNILALVGYRPDTGLARELQVQTCWATEGTYALAAALLSQEGASDCLTAGAGLDGATLRHPEPGFFTVGMKSYGRNSNFLLQAGFKQVEDLLELIEDADPA